MIEFVGFASFYHPDPRPRTYHKDNHFRLQLEISLVDDQGRAYTTWDWKEVPVGQLLRASEAGAFDGDPHRPAIVLLPQMGDGAFTLLYGLGQLWDAFNFLLDAGPDALDWVGRGVTAAQVAKWLKQIKQRMECAPQTMDSHYKDWQTRGFRPDTLGDVLELRPRTTAEVAKLFGMSEEEAEALLLGYGFVRSEEDGKWRPREDEIAKLLSGNVTMIANGGNFRRENVELILKERLEELVKTGTAPDPDWDVWHRFQPVEPPPGMEEPGVIDELGDAASSWWQQLKRDVRRVRRQLGRRERR